MKLSNEEERRRQEDLARQRLEAARQRKLQGENLVRGESIVIADGELTDDSKLEEAVLKVLDKRHRNERDLLIKVCNCYNDKVFNLC